MTGTAVNKLTSLFVKFKSFFIVSNNGPIDVTAGRKFNAIRKMASNNDVIDF
jgi:hypothetical protein